MLIQIYQYMLGYQFGCSSPNKRKHELRICGATIRSSGVGQLPTNSKVITQRFFWNAIKTRMFESLTSVILTHCLDMVSVQQKTFKRTTFSAKKIARNAQPRKYISPSPSLLHPHPQLKTLSLICLSLVFIRWKSSLKSLSLNGHHTQW
jgi:hypothetical protein